MQYFEGTKKVYRWISLIVCNERAPAKSYNCEEGFNQHLRVALAGWAMLIFLDHLRSLLVSQYTPKIYILKRLVSLTLPVQLPPAAPDPHSTVPDPGEPWGHIEFYSPSSYSRWECSSMRQFSCLRRVWPWDQTDQCTSRQSRPMIIRVKNISIPERPHHEST